MCKKSLYLVEKFSNPMWGERDPRNRMNYLGSQHCSTFKKAQTLARTHTGDYTLSTRMENKTRVSIFDGKIAMAKVRRVKLT